MRKIRVIISGGGTAGHIFPALSIADELNLQKNKYEILFIGAKNRMEIYHDSFHEIYNDLDRDRVISDLKNFINSFVTA